MARLQAPAMPAEPEGTPRSAYGRAVYAARDAIAERARRAAEFDHPQLPAAESLELLRATLHHEVDDLVDAEALRHPSAHKLIVRVPRYHELADWLLEAA